MFSVCESKENLLVCQMGPTLCPTTLKDFAAAHMTLAGEKPVLSLALSLGWLILSPA